MEVNKVLKIASDQNQRLAELAKNGDTNLETLHADYIGVVQAR